jgi:hypothetical protein
VAFLLSEAWGANGGSLTAQIRIRVIDPEARFGHWSVHYSAEWLPSVFNEAVFSGARRVFEKTFSRINAGESMAFPVAVFPLRNAPTHGLVPRGLNLSSRVNGGHEKASVGLAYSKSPVFWHVSEA